MTTATEEATKPAPAKGILVTEKALAKVRSAMAKEGISPEQGGLRLGVQGGGCSGLSYNIRFDTQPRERDRIFHLSARHDPGLSGNVDATGLRLRESPGVEIVRLWDFILRLMPEWRGRHARGSATARRPQDSSSAC